MSAEALQVPGGVGAGRALPGPVGAAAVRKNLCVGEVSSPTRVLRTGRAAAARAGRKREKGAIQVIDADEMARKTRWLVAISRFIDAHRREPTAQEAQELAADPAPVQAPEVPLPDPYAGPGLQSAIALAERAGEWEEVAQLKTRLLEVRKAQLDGSVPTPQSMPAATS
jgi:hypothetical protein